MRVEPLDRAKQIATVGLSFRVVAGSGVFPPPDVLNAFLACGYDDVDDPEGVLRWEPFALTPAEYDQLVQWWKTRHPAAGTDRLAVGGADFSDWFARAVNVIKSRAD